jgi:hypothetical protein
MLSSSPPQSDPVVTTLPRTARPAAGVAPVRGPIRLPQGRRTLLYGIAVAAWLSGVLWLVFHHFIRVETEFGQMASPLEAWWLKLHGAAAFAALWVFGLLWGVHVVNGWTARRRRWSGGVLFGAAVALIGSSYLLYYSGHDGLRNLASTVHWVLGQVAPALFVWHRYLARERD